ncbi:hypothetical protein [Deinococcus radiotolerans]|uniref:Uncharacterized protein n=1 Tax=Deinococcus radiotolerans TaxID=1309407 RepID=A0ABQ2FQM8_9DEIO|nr:hypothetical protein [Deinococcus radiotolerans]GGL16848.1 hypothetical protein GCM10010844_39720 [Deinococcus radiotolerans]
MHNDTKPRNISRTWTVSLYGRYESGSAKVKLGTHTVTLSADGRGDRCASIDGQSATVAAANALLNSGKRDGTVKLEREVRIGLPKPAASRLHRDLALMGILAGNHYAVATAALGRVISSLTEVQPHEAESVRLHASRLAQGLA